MTRTIELTQNKVALVDDDVFEELNRWNWYAIKGGRTYYARRAGGRINGSMTAVIMHREIFRLNGLPEPLQVDHRNGDGLDNRFENLRPATNQQNMWNRPRAQYSNSRFKGVCHHSRDDCWQAAITNNGRQIYLGSFANEVAAAHAYDTAAQTLFGPFARLNFPEQHQYQLEVRKSA